MSSDADVRSLPQLRHTGGQGTRITSPNNHAEAAIKQTKFRGFKLFYENEEATESMIRAIDEFPSFFSPGCGMPLFIDCGANIGVSVLEWKTRWPMARVICFEPDPESFRLLQRNIQCNDIPGVECIEAALSDAEGVAVLYGELGKRADSRGNSLEALWGKRPGGGETRVRSTQLSKYLRDQSVDFLKLDIEGAEERVLKEARLYLGNVAAMYVEVHETDALISRNAASRVVKLIRSAGFSVESESRYAPHALPGHLSCWQQAVGARQSHLLCYRS